MSLDALVQAVQAVATQPIPGIRQGTVTNLTPLAVQLDGDPAPLTEQPWVLGPPLSMVGQRVLSIWWEGHRAVIGAAIDTGWQPVTLTNGWGGYLSVRRISNLVHLRGRLTTVPADKNATIAMLTAGYRPTGDEHQTGAILASSARFVQLVISTGGHINVWIGYGGTPSGHIPISTTWPV